MRHKPRPLRLQLSDPPASVSEPGHARGAGGTPRERLEPADGADGSHNRRLTRQELATNADPLLTASEVGTLLRVPPKAVYGLAIPKIAISPRRYRWRRSDVITFLENRRTK